MVYISLIDHVHTSIVRFLDGVTVKNVLLWDIRRFYKDEYQIGLWALNLVEEKCKVRLPEDEAGFIALHLAMEHIAIGTSRISTWNLLWASVPERKNVLSIASGFKSSPAFFLKQLPLPMTIFS